MIDAITRRANTIIEHLKKQKEEAEKQHSLPLQVDLSSSSQQQATVESVLSPELLAVGHEGSKLPEGRFFFTIEFLLF